MSGGELSKFSERTGRDMIICIDEAQCDLQESIGDPEPIPLLSYMMVHVQRDIIHPYGRRSLWPMVISGTALQADKAIKVIEQHLPMLLRRNVNRYPDSLLSTFFASLEDLKISFKENFLIIRGDTDFDELLRKQKWMNDSIPDFIVKEIKENAKPLRGRYKWSVCYLEEIGKLGDPKNLSSDEIQKSCEVVVLKAKEGLKDRLRDIEERAFVEALAQFKQHCSNLRNVGFEVVKKEEEKMQKGFQRQQRLHTKLLDELCWLAIRSDLFGESSVFESEKCAKNGRARFCLCRRTRFNQSGKNDSGDPEGEACGGSGN